MSSMRSRQRFGYWPRGSSVCDRREWQPSEIERERESNKVQFQCEPFPPGHYYRQHNVHGSAEFLAYRLHARHNAVADLVGRVLRHIVRAHHQHDGARFDVVQFAVLQAPQRVLRLVAVNAEVEAVHGRKVRVPHVRLLQRLQDAIADEDDVRILGPALGEEAVVLFGCVV